MEEGKYKIYALVDPRDEQVRYIGQSISPERRYKDHIMLRTYGIPAKDKWIKELLTIGLKPTLTIIDSCNAEQEARELEGYWMCYHHNEGANLFNGEVYDSSSYNLQARLFARAAVVANRPRIVWKTSEESEVTKKPENSTNDVIPTLEKGVTSLEEEVIALRAENARLRSIIRQITNIVTSEESIL
jgi:hypothetical protein